MLVKSTLDYIKLTQSCDSHSERMKTNQKFWFRLINLMFTILQNCTISINKKKQNFILIEKLMEKSCNFIFDFVFLFFVFLLIDDRSIYVIDLFNVHRDFRLIDFIYYFSRKNTKFHKTELLRVRNEWVFNCCSTFIND